MSSTPPITEPEETRPAAPEPPVTLIVYVAVMFVSWLVFWVAAPHLEGQELWVSIAQQLPGFVIALLLAEALYRRSKFGWGIGLFLGAAAIALGVLNAGQGGSFANVFSGGQIVAGALEIVLLITPPTVKWVHSSV